MHADAVAVFAASALGVIPTAALMGRATEELAARSGPGIGGLLNVTFGNAPELIIALFALGAGLHEVVKASLVGSILGNILLVLGVSMLVGGRKRDRQRFESRAATAQSLMLLLATVALVMPAIFQLVAGGGLPDLAAKAVAFPTDLQALSVGVAIVLLASYAAALVFSLKTHAHLFNPSHDEEEHGGEPWSVRKSVLMLAGAGAAVGWMFEILVHSITEASASIGLSPFFVGVIVVAIVGNAAEHWVAVYFAGRDKMDIAVNIAVGSGAQIALFVAPVLVLASFVIGPFPMALVFNGFELGAVFLAVIIANEVNNAASPPGTKACNSPSTSSSDSPSSSFDAHGLPGGSRQNQIVLRCSSFLDTEGEMTSLAEGADRRTWPNQHFVRGSAAGPTNR